MAGAPDILIEAFEARFGATRDLFRAPGRVNLIGEHTDYNLGLVLPIAIDLACYAASTPSPDGMLRIYSLNLEEGREWPAAAVGDLSPARDWTDYFIGVARQIPSLEPRNIMLYSTVPLGSGLSSSASMEVSSALALGWQGADPLDLARLCQRAENDFVGLPSGILDQYASIFGREGAAMKIDCRTLESELVSLPGEVAIIAVNTMVKHELGGSAYRDRVAECARAVEQIRAGGRDIASLRDAEVDDLLLVTDEVARKRARHVIAENARVERFAAACRLADLATMGQLFVASHRSLQHEYEVSCAELDFLVDAALSVPGVYGARMTGGGFGGCTVNLVAPGAVVTFTDALDTRYRDRFGVEPQFYRVEASAGASRLTNGART